MASDKHSFSLVASSCPPNFQGFIRGENPQIKSEMYLAADRTSWTKPVSEDVNVVYGVCKVFRD